MTMEDFNAGVGISETESKFRFTTVLKVTGFEMSNDCSYGSGERGEGIKIVLEGINPDGQSFKSYKTQRLKRDENGNLKKWIYGGGTTKDGNEILPSLAWEIKELCKKYIGEDNYNALKETYGKGELTRNVFLHMEFEMEVKMITVKESNSVVYISMFAYDRKKDEAYAKKQEEEIDVEEVSKGIEEADKVRDFFDSPVQAEKPKDVSITDLPF